MDMLSSPTRKPWIVMAADVVHGFYPWRFLSWEIIDVRF